MPPSSSPPASRAANAEGHPLSARDRRALDRAFERYEHSFREAIVLAERVVRRNPESAEAWRGYAYAQIHPYVQRACREALSRWRALAPDDPEIPAFEAGLAYSGTEYAEALAHARRALELSPHNFEMLLAKAMCERFLRLPEHTASLAAARKADPSKYAEHAEWIRATEAYGSLEIQSSFERMMLIGSAADEGDVARARRLLALSEAEIAFPGPWIEFREEMKQRIEKAERRRRGRSAARAVPRRPRLGQRASMRVAPQRPRPPPEAPGGP